jgi:glutamyl-tRNA reductase
MKLPGSSLLLVGVNHKTAPVEVRERFAIPEARLTEAMQALLAQPGVEEGVILSTCNRVEVLARSRNGAAPDVNGFFREFLQVDPAAHRQHIYQYEDAAAVRHIFRVASSLDSMVLGEPQILGQVKEAYAAARASGAVHSQLDALLTRAFAVAKRVRTETAIGSSAVSVASVAVELAKKIFGTLEGKRVYLVGAGKMSELAARHLIAHGAARGAGQITVANRTYERARELAARFSGDAIPFEKLYETADRADIIISSTGSPEPIFRREHAEVFLARRKNRPIFFIDIAVPRDVAPEVNKLGGVFVYDIDDLQQVVASHVSDRRREAERAEAIVAAEVERFSSRLGQLDVVPTIVSLQEHLEMIRQAEIDRARGRLGALTPEQESAIEALTRGIVNKVLHAPISSLKDAAQKESGPQFAEQIRRMFNLPQEQDGTLDPHPDAARKAAGRGGNH